MDEPVEKILTAMGQQSRKRFESENVEPTKHEEELIMQVRQQLTSETEGGPLKLGEAEVAHQLAQAIHNQRPLSESMQKSIVDRAVEELAPKPGVFSQLQALWRRRWMWLTLPTLVAASLFLGVTLNKETNVDPLVPMHLEVRGHQKQWQGPDDTREGVANYTPTSRLQILIRGDEGAEIGEDSHIAAWAMTADGTLRTVYPGGAFVLTRGPSGFLLEAEAGLVLGEQPGLTHLWVVVSNDDDALKHIQGGSSQTLTTTLNALKSDNHTQVWKTPIEIISP